MVEIMFIVRIIITAAFFVFESNLTINVLFHLFLSTECRMLREQGSQVGRGLAN